MDVAKCVFLECLIFLLKLLKASLKKKEVERKYPLFKCHFHLIGFLS